MPKEKNDVLEKLKKLAKEQKDKDLKKEKSKKEKKNKKDKDVRTPMTKEDYEKKRSVIRTVYDADTGRMRRVRATGEIVDSIITREQHRQINKMSTLTDGLTYQSNLFHKSNKE
ncbi:unnamed protein product [Mucor hiemalis]